MATTPNYTVNYEDERFKEVEQQKEQALTDVDSTYNPMIENADQYYQSQIDASKEWADKQSQIQNENTNFQIEQINQQKEQAQKDYTKEQSGAYVDWQKQSNKYGVNAEQMAMNGMQNTGLSESSQVAMYNTYQNRVAIARESLAKTMQNFDNNIQQAILQNNSALAEISYKALQQQLELSLQGFQYKNSLLMEQANKKQEVDDRYYTRYQDVVSQINQENAMTESIRQFNEQQALAREQMAQAQAQWEEEQRVAQEQWQKEYELAKTEAERKALLEERQMQLAENEYNATYGEGGTMQIQQQQQQQQQQEQIAKEKGEAYGNTSKTTSKADYYFSNGYQPQYVNDTKLAKSGMTTSILPKDLGIPGGQNIWKAGNRYYAWNGATKSYIDVTSDVTYSNGYQPKYIGNNELKSAGTIKSTIGSYGDLPSSQNVWKAGSKYYVWNGKSKSYEDVTSKYNEYIKKQTKKNEAINNAVMNVYGGGNVWM